MVPHIISKDLACSFYNRVHLYGFSPTLSPLYWLVQPWQSHPPLCWRDIRQHANFDMPPQIVSGLVLIVCHKHLEWIWM
jgi:hypothetical protein